MRLRDFQLSLALSVALLAGIFLYRSLGVESPGVYVFQGCAARAKMGKAYFPVVRANSRKIEVNTGKGLSRTSYKSPCIAEPRMVLTDRLVEVLEMKCHASLNSEARKRSAKRSSGRSGGRNAKESEVRMEVDVSDRARMGNSVHLSCKIRSPEGIPEAYGLLVVAFDRPDPNTGSVPVTKRIAAAHYVGDLLEGEIMDLGLDFSLTEFPFENARYSFHLYSKNGEEMALTNSSGLRELSAEEYVELKLRLEGFQ